MKTHFQLEVDSKFYKHFSDSYLLKWDFVYTFLTVGYCVYYTRRITNFRSPPYVLIVLFIIYFVNSYLITGERDIVFRFIIILILMHITLYKDIKKAYPEEAGLIDDYRTLEFDLKNHKKGDDFGGKMDSTNLRYREEERIKGRQSRQYEKQFTEAELEANKASIIKEYEDIGLNVKPTSKMKPEYTPTGSKTKSKARSKVSRLQTVRAIADYQFGFGVGEQLIPDHAQIKSSRSGFWIFADGARIASSSGYGTISLTLAGAALMPPDIYRVRIDDFLPKGSVLAPGVVDADPQIRQMDEVIVQGSMAIGVGRAMMSGPEMVGSSRGLAVDLRAVEGT